MKSMGSGKRKRCQSSSSSSSDASEESKISSVSSLSTDNDKKCDSEPPKSDDEILEVPDMHSAETEADAAGVDPQLTRRGPGEGGDGIHVSIRRQAELEEWPDGPSSLAELFRWQSSNARHFIGVDSKDQGHVRLRRLLRALELDLEIHESYGGSGNGAATLHQQHRALVQQASATIAALNSLGGLAQADSSLAKIRLNSAQFFLHTVNHRPQLTQLTQCPRLNLKVLQNYLFL